MEVVLRIEEEHIRSASEAASTRHGYDTFVSSMQEQAPGMSRAFNIWMDETASEFAPYWRTGARVFSVNARWLLGGLSAAYGGFPSIDLEWVENFKNSFNAHELTPAGSLSLYDGLHRYFHEINDRWMGLFCGACLESGIRRTVPESSGYYRILLLGEMFITAIEKENGIRDREEHKAQLEIDKEAASAFIEVIEGAENIDFI